ncbi:ATP-binding protein [Altererythrobacter lutimaris]|uniref:histidine kinase n=1 Tax=Altererythrobacter lutimaris TaxID=2743979 RepID=A0A850HEW4_9SPHN|nr:ATP-binding protein [Altererythrobacter lutimaris]NVE95666.1 response regulator [Altererythrobacter lutimaris]
MVMQEKEQSWRAWARSGGYSVVLFACVCGMLLFGGLAWVSLEFTRMDSRIAAVWVPNAVAVALLLRFSIPKEHLFLLSLWIGNSIANMVGGDTPFSAASLAACNAIEIQLAVSLTRAWCGPRPDMQKIGDLACFLAAAAIIAPMSAATLAMLALQDQPIGPLATWAKWAATDGLGMAIIAPSLMILIDALRDFTKPNSKRLAEWSVILVGGAIAMMAIFGQSAVPVLFMALPIIVLHAFRLGAAGTAIGIATAAFIAIEFTAAGLGPISALDASDTIKLIVLQVYLAAAFLMGLPVAAMLAGRDRALEELAAKQSEISLLTDSITDAVLHFDRERRCTYASRSVQQVLGSQPEDLIGQISVQRAHPESESQVTAVEERLLRGESEQERIVFRRQQDDEEGRPVYIEADCAVVREEAGGPATGIVVSAREVTDRVELEMQLTRARRIAEEAARGKSEFLANMSHEIRTPMNGVLGFAELLSESGLPPEQQHHAKLIVQSGRSMMMLLNDILDLAKIEAGHVTIEREATDLGELIRDCVRLHQASAQKKGLALTCEGARQGPYIITDDLRLRQILLNLLSNAVKFTETGSITLRHSIRDNFVNIEIEDTGIGIDEERLATIFDPFEQAESDTARRFGGTGLGLTISRQLAELLEGQLDVASAPGVGSHFMLRIPYDRAPDMPQPAAPKEAAVHTDIPIQPAHILLAEDHDINRMLVTAMLERCGQRVTVARDGEEAIEAVLGAFSESAPFDLVLMDIQMPGCDGYFATRTIRAEGIRASDLPIIALTANAYPEDIAAAREAGMQGHLAKPLAFADLVQALQRWLPVRIVEETSELATPSAHQAPGNDPAGTVHSPSLVEKWQVRRRETLDAVSAALRDDALRGEDAEALANLVHTLAGTAGMFGEAKLGECASELERSLKNDAQSGERRGLAKQLLETARTASSLKGQTADKE